tara:strand:+ start:2422 stop:4419 length:1998 start_codon:yes stop_codon:yes gene_type:complete
MAENQILVKFKPSGEQKLINAINQLHLAQVKLEKGQRAYERALAHTSRTTQLFGTRNKRLAQTNSVLANSFATIRSKMLLVSFAMSLGIRQMVQFGKESMKVANISKAYNTLAGATEDSGIAFSKLNTAVDGTMTKTELLTQANNAMILGVSKNSDEMAEMFDVAQRLGRALGQDTAHSVESLITGIGRQSRLMLDNIGIIVKAEEAYEAYAKEVGKTTEDLTDQEKKLAFNKAAMDAARTAVARLGAEQLSAQDKFDKFNVALNDLSILIGEKFVTTVLPALETMTGWIKKMTETDMETTIRQLGQVGAEFENIAQLQRLLAMDVAAQTLEDNTKTIKVLLNQQSNAFLDVLEDTQLMSLGVQQVFTNISGTTVKDGISRIESYGQAWQLTQEAFDNLSVEKVQGEIDKINESANFLVNKFAEGLINSEQLENSTNKLVDQQKAFQIILDLLIEIQAAKGVLSPANLTGDKDENSDGEKTLSFLDKLQIKLKNVKDEQANLAKATVASAFATGMAYDNMGKAIEAGLRDAIEASIRLLTVKLMEDAVEKFGWLGVPLAASAGAVAGSLVGQAQRHLKFEDGGLVGGRRHSQGGTMIEAERGEFVMSRNAVEAIGVENLNRMNQGGGGAVNITFTGNVMSQDFIENEAIPQIKDAIRRGADIGVS